jgi:hypothetical protein
MVPNSLTWVLSEMLATPLTEKIELLKTDHQRETKKIADDLLRAQADARKDQAAMAEKLDFLEKSFQKERDSFDKERAVFEARIVDLKQACEREVQLVKENADTKIATTSAAKGKAPAAKKEPQDRTQKETTTNLKG